MRVVAFLQNCWFPPGTPAIITNRYLNDPKYRRVVLSRTMSGRRLVRAFGIYYNEIWWDNASQAIGEFPQSRHPADIRHMSRVIEENAPLTVLAFGRVAADGIMELQHGRGVSLEWHFSPHPNARGITQFQLDNFAKVIIDKYLNLQQ